MTVIICTQFGRRQLLRANIASFISCFLEEAQIPNILWGEQAVDILLNKERKAFESRRFEFVIPDDSLDAAIRELDRFDEHELCHDPNCVLIQPNHDLQVPDAHFHSPSLEVLPAAVPGDIDDIGIDTISLFVKSKVLWWLPDLSLDPFLKSNDVMIAKDCHRWCSGWQSYATVKVLKPMAFVEALIFLLARDSPHQNSGFIYWQTLFYAMTGQCFPIKGCRPLRPDFRNFWLELNYLPMYQPEAWDLLQGVREKLIEANELAPVEFGFNGPHLHPTRELVDLQDLQDCGKAHDSFAVQLTCADCDMKKLLLKSFMEYSK